MLQGAKQAEQARMWIESIGSPTSWKLKPRQLPILIPSLILIRKLKLKPDPRIPTLSFLCWIFIRLYLFPFSYFDNRALKATPEIKFVGQHCSCSSYGGLKFDTGADKFFNEGIAIMMYWHALSGSGMFCPWHAVKLWHALSGYGMRWHALACAGMCWHWTRIVVSSVKWKIVPFVFSVIVSFLIY